MNDNILLFFFELKWLTSHFLGEDGDEFIVEYVVIDCVTDAASYNSDG